MTNASRGSQAVWIGFGLCVAVALVALVALASTDRSSPPMSAAQVATPAAIDIAPSSALETPMAAPTTSVDFLLAPIAGGDSRADGYRLEQESCCVGN